MQEIEVKILNINITELKKILDGIHAKIVKSENQINKIFDFSDRRLINNHGYARIRIVEDLLKKQQIYYMTTKKLLSNTEFKIMSENETEIKNAEEGEKIFGALGLELVQTIFKYRESYKYKNTLIEIDVNDKSFCPFPYIEIEAPTENELIKTVELLGYTMKDTTSLSIYDILKDKGL
ncbi:MAG: adenylate cyclase [Clostridiaceae bacterium]|nr:adenylate cyclase [Clostridiaceae bacterium]